MLGFAKALAHHIAQEQQQEDMLTDADIKAAQTTRHVPATGVLCEPKNDRDSLETSGHSTWLLGRIGSSLTAGVHRLLDHARAPAQHGEALADDNVSDHAIVPSMPESLEYKTSERG